MNSFNEFNEILYFNKYVAKYLLAGGRNIVYIK